MSSYPYVAPSPELFETAPWGGGAINVLTGAHPGTLYPEQLKDPTIAKIVAEKAAALAARDDQRYDEIDKFEREYRAGLETARNARAEQQKAGVQTFGDTVRGGLNATQAAARADINDFVKATPKRR